MSIRKEDVYKLVERMDEKETNLAYKLLTSIINDKGKRIYEIMEADNAPLDEEEKVALAEVVKEETVNWEDVKRELDL